MSATQTLFHQICIWCLVNLSVHPVMAAYYSTLALPYSQDSSEYLCNYKGKYLASIQTESQKKNVNALCKEFDDKCWIGLQIHLLNEYKNSTIMRWIDGCNVDVSFINQSLCQNYQQIINYTQNNIIYYSYIDTVDNCWKITTNSSIPMCGVCGPQMFDTTGWYWICNVIVPMILAVVFFIYCIYSFIFLTYHLCIFEHNYPDKNLEATIPIKITALLIPGINLIASILLFAGFITLYIAYEATELFPPISSFDSDYPYIFTQIGYIAVTILSLWFFYIPLSYIHVLLRLRHAFNHNVIMKGAIPFRHCYLIVMILILFYFILPFLYIIVNSEMSSTNNNSFKLAVLMSIMACFLITDVIINGVLLYLYVKGLQKFSKEHYFRRDEAEIYANYTVKNQRQHELMVEATRYTVLFSIVLIFNMLTVCIIIAIYGYSQYYRSQRKFPWAPVAADYIRNGILFVFLFIKEVLLLMAVQLSFVFSHTKYEILCGKCDTKIKKMCHDMVQKENAKIVREYKLNEKSKCKLKHNLNNLQQPLLMNEKADKVELESVSTHTK